MTAGHPYPAAFAVERAKVTRYLFASCHADGAPKGGFLMRCGFSADRPLNVMDALQQHPSPVTWIPAFEAHHGVKFDFDGLLARPDGRNPVVRTVWQADYDGDGRTACFITLKSA